MVGMWFSMCTLKFVSNKYTVLYFREDKSTCGICTVTVEEQNIAHLVCAHKTFHIYEKLIRT